MADLDLLSRDRFRPIFAKLAFPRESVAIAKSDAEMTELQAGGQRSMGDAEKARKLFQEAGLTFPNIPEELAKQLKEQDKWLFSTREISRSPYNLQHYVCEVNVGDYVILSHSGHGVNSYAIQYYLVYKALRMFLHLGWGGAYMDARENATKIRDCFSLANEIIATVQNVGGVLAGDRLTIVGSDFCGSYWSLPPEHRRDGPEGSKSPAAVLTEALHWLREHFAA